MARVKRSRSRSREFYREKQKTDPILQDPEQEMKERREKRQEQLKKDKAALRRLKKEERREARAAERDLPPELTPREKAARRRARLIYAAVLLTVLFFLGRAAWKAAQIKAEETAALQREQELQLRLDKLREELTHIDSAEYIEEKARTELHMIFPGEMIYLINRNIETKRDAEKESPSNE